MRYRFRLERILELREKEEGLKEREFATLKELLEKERMRASSARDAYEEGVARFLDGSGMDLHRLEMMRLYIRRMREEVERCEEGVRMVEKASEAKSRELQEVRREVKTLEYLKERGLKRYRKVEAVREQAVTDEYNSRRYANGLQRDRDGD